MARANGAMIRKAYDLKDRGLTIEQIKVEVDNTNIGSYFPIRPILEKGEMPPDAGSKYSLPACKDFIDNWNKPKCVEVKAEDIPNDELSAKDKKELAMYAIDQHYFFLKQLTGVI